MRQLCASTFGSPVPRSFVAIDFETADDGYDSACAVALVRVDEGVIVERWQRLIRPPRTKVPYQRIHGLSSAELATAKPFFELYQELTSRLANSASSTVVAAHNAGFDRAVLNTCCASGRLRVPRLRWLCTVELARKCWAIHPTSLPNVCARLGIPLKHHTPLSDAEACARIVLAAETTHPIVSP